MMKLGAHMSIAGGVYNAFARGQSVGCDTIQIFTKSSNQWYSKPLTDDDLTRFRQEQERTGIAPVVAHDSYLINLGTPDETLWQKSLTAFIDEVGRCDRLGIPYLVMHPGSHMGAGEAFGLKRIADGLNRTRAAHPQSTIQVLLEITAGQGGHLGYRFEQIARLIAAAEDPDFLGVCFDTAHALAAGYDLRTPDTCAQTFAEFDRIIGLNRLKCFHFNDSKKPLGSRVDRHDQIGQGTLGLEPFRLILNDPRFKNIPMILETPKSEDLHEDIENLRVLRSLIA